MYICILRLRFIAFVGKIFVRTIFFNECFEKFFKFLTEVLKIWIVSWKNYFSFCIFWKNFRIKWNEYKLISHLFVFFFCFFTLEYFHSAFLEILHLAMMISHRMNAPFSLFFNGVVLLSFEFGIYTFIFFLNSIFWGIEAKEETQQWKWYMIGAFAFRLPKQTFQQLINKSRMHGMILSYFN